MLGGRRRDFISEFPRRQKRQRNLDELGFSWPSLLLHEFREPADAAHVPPCALRGEVAR